jgi:hypothetical protein
MSEQDEKTENRIFGTLDGVESALDLAECFHMGPGGASLGQALSLYHGGEAISDALSGDRRGAVSNGVEALVDSPFNPFGGLIKGGWGLVSAITGLPTLGKTLGNAANGVLDFLGVGGGGDPLAFQSAIGSGLAAINGALAQAQHPELAQAQAEPQAGNEDSWADIAGW